MGHVSIHVKLNTLCMLPCKFGVGLGWGGACQHSCEVEHAVHVTLQVWGGFGVGWGMLAFM